MHFKGYLMTKNSFVAEVTFKAVRIVTSVTLRSILSKLRLLFDWFWASQFTLNWLYKLETCTLTKKKLQHRYFPLNFTKFLRKPTLQITCIWLRLKLEANLKSLKIQGKVTVQEPHVQTETCIFRSFIKRDTCKGVFTDVSRGVLLPVNRYGMPNSYPKLTKN